MSLRGFATALGAAAISIHATSVAAPAASESARDAGGLKYWVANANLSLSPASGAPWTVTLWGRNIIDKASDITRNFFLPGTEVAQAGEPTTVGIRVSYKY